MDRDPKEEEALLAACRRGEEAAWDELFQLHYDPACRFVYQLASDFSRDDAEEICQEAFLAAVRSLKSFHGASRFQTWLFRIAANKARDFRDKRNAMKRGGGKTQMSLDFEDPETGLKPDRAADDPTPDQVLLNRESNTFLGEALDALGDPCREIIQLRYFGDLSYEEIGAVTEANVKTVSSRLSRCLDKLEQISRAIFSGDEPEVLPSNQ